jgi:hypothetical protein
MPAARLRGVALVAGGEVTGLIIICEPRKDCADPNVNRWHCMRGHDGAAAGVCPLAACERQGANRGPYTEQETTK